MKINALPHYDDSVNTTGCCPRFNPEGWNDRHLHFENKRFIRATTASEDHVPVDMAQVFSRVQNHIDAAGGRDYDNCIVLSRDLSAVEAEHLFSISAPVEDEQTVTLSGDFITRVFEGPYENAPDWYSDMEERVREHGSTPGDIYFFYTTCPGCAQVYGRNVVVGVAKV